VHGLIFAFPTADARPPRGLSGLRFDGIQCIGLAPPPKQDFYDKRDSVSSETLTGITLLLRGP